MGMSASPSYRAGIESRSVRTSESASTKRLSGFQDWIEFQDEATAVAGRIRHGADINRVGLDFITKVAGPDGTTVFFKVVGPEECVGAFRAWMVRQGLLSVPPAD